MYPINFHVLYKAKEKLLSIFSLYREQTDTLYDKIVLKY